MRHTRARIHLLQRRQRGQTRNPRIRRHLSRHAACKNCFTSAATFATRPPHRWNRSCCWLIETTALLFVSPEVGWRSTENISPEYLCDLVKAFCERSRPDCVRWTWILLSSRGRLASSHLLGVTRWFDFAATFPLWGLNADAQSQLEALRGTEQPPTLKTTPAQSAAAADRRLTGCCFFSPCFSSVWASASYYWCLTAKNDSPK